MIAPAYAGGEFTYDHFARLTLRVVGGNVFDIFELDLFYAELGWVSVFRDGKYCEVDAS